MFEDVEEAVKNETWVPSVRDNSGSQEVVAWPLIRPMTADLEQGTVGTAGVHGSLLLLGSGALTLSCYSRCLTILTPGCLQEKGGSQSGGGNGRCGGRKGVGDR